MEEKGTDGQSVRLFVRWPWALRDVRISLLHLLLDVPVFCLQNIWWWRTCLDDFRREAGALSCSTQNTKTGP